MKNKITIKKSLVVFMSFLLLFASAACGGENETSKTPDASSVSQVSEASVEDDSSVAAVESTEESSEVSTEEPSGEISEIKQVVKEPDYTIE